MLRPEPRARARGHMIHDAARVPHPSPLAKGGGLIACPSPTLAAQRWGTQAASETMPSIVIDNRKVEVAQGSTILDAARLLGLDIPTLCFVKDYRPSTSCMLCLVKLKPANRFVPSCATLVQDGMEIESETQEVRQVRRTGLDLLLSDHAGDCAAPCQNTCPCHMDIPLMLRQVAAGELADAIVTIKRDIALPAVLGRVCPELCERTCRRSEFDSPATICLVKRYAADIDLASESPYLPPCQPSTGKKVAIVGTGPTGLSAAYHLLQTGHACVLFDQHSQPGGMLRYQTDEEQLPRSVLEAEIAIIRRLGAVFQMDTKIGRDKSLASLTEEFDAVLLTTGPLDDRDADPLLTEGVQTSAGCILADPKTHETPMAGVFAAGDAVKPSKLVVRSVADGKDAAVNIDQFLSGATPTGPTKAFTVRMGRLTRQEIDMLACGTGCPPGGCHGQAEARNEAQLARVDPRANHGQTSLPMPPRDSSSVDGTGLLAGHSGLTHEQAKAEAARCLQCDCGQSRSCRLRHYAQMYGASPNRYQGTRRVFERSVLPSPDGANVFFEPGKCILCGLCVQVATEAREPLGLTFIGRGFDVRVGVPFDQSIAEGLTVAARRCAEICPTGAITLRTTGLCEACSSACCDLRHGEPPSRGP